MGRILYSPAFERDKQKRALSSPFSQNIAPLLSGRQCFADLKTDEATDCEFVAEFFPNAGHMLAHCDFGIALHEALVNEANRLEKLLQLALDDFGDRLSGFAFDLFGGDLFLFLDEGWIDLFTRNSAGISRSDLQGDIADEFAECFTRGG